MSEIPHTPTPSSELEIEFHKRGEAIKAALPVRPLLALSLYQQEEKVATSPLVERYRQRFGETMECVEAGQKIDDPQGLLVLPDKYASARKLDAKRLLGAAIERLLELRDEHEVLERIGKAFKSLVLEGTLQQQFCCKLAARIALRGEAEIPPPLKQYILEPLVEALRDVIRVGAEMTRDAAIEGLGGLLKVLGEPATRYVPDVRPDDDRGNRELNEQYFARLGRRRLMVLTVAGDQESRDNFYQRIREPIHDVLRGIRANKTSIENALYERADLLRIIPAVLRQHAQHAPPWDLASILCDAAGLVGVSDEDPPEVLIAFARYQESVFRTIDASMRRTEVAEKFDERVAAAVRAIPRTLAGPPAVCNAQIRAAIAIVRTAIALVRYIHGDSETKTALRPLVKSLEQPTPWSNLGIAEGWYRGLPSLLRSSEHNDLTTIGLKTLFEHLRRPHDARNLAQTHGQLIAGSCLRRILISLADHIHERHLDEHSYSAARVERRKGQRELRALLRDPNPARVLHIFQPHAFPAPAHDDDDSHYVAEIVINQVSFESELLVRTSDLLASWEKRSSVEKVLLTRILASQLHAISRDMPEIARYPVLKHVFNDLLSVATTEEAAMTEAWKTLSSLPPGAAQAADPDIQRFVEYRGRKKRTDADAGGAPVEDLAGYVLAMISPDASSRIAGGIAREIDLNLRHAGQRCAEILYQVMLRGPHESIFDHLLPRINDRRNRDLILLFRKHVDRVLHGPCKGDEFDTEHLKQHVRELLDQDLKRTKNPMLIRLREALTIFRDLTMDSKEVWSSLKDGKVLELFLLLDKLAASDPFREALYADYRKRIIDLQNAVRHYLGVSIKSFKERGDFLGKAAEAAKSIEDDLKNQAGLQPPERTLLVALMQHLRSLFELTTHWYCDAPLTWTETRSREKKGFWMIFTTDPATWVTKESRIRFRTLSDQLRGDPEEREIQLRVAERIRDLRTAGPAPPQFEGQRAKFREFAIAWMSSDLDLPSLKKVLKQKWPPRLMKAYELLTSYWYTAVLITLPCLVAIGFHAAHLDWLAGSLFFIVATGLVLTSLFAFTHGAEKFLRRESPSTWFQALLPRLARLIAVPMALIVEFDHSYDFAMEGSTQSILLLMLFAFLATRFFVRRELVNRPERPGHDEFTPAEQEQMSQIVPLALSHAFTVAMLFSIIFADAHVGESPHRQTFLHILPRVVTFDLCRVLGLSDIMRFNEQHYLRFTFYPTIILTWTALGLFFGVFLEGFMKGVRLRGEATANEPAE